MKWKFALAIGWLGLASAFAAAEPSSTDKLPSARALEHIRKEVETLRGKHFIRQVPVRRISEKDLRDIADRELEKQYPGRKLRGYEELLSWLDMAPAGTDLKAVSGDFLVAQVAGLYDSEAKEMCLPQVASGSTNVQKKAAEKKLEQISLGMDSIVLAHEFTHALEDQYWPIDDPKDDDTRPSTDRGTAHSFVLEGSATRAMIEAIPAQTGLESPLPYFAFWNLLHSRLGELVLKNELRGVWQSSDALVEGVPETLARSESMPYSFGYLFCTEILRRWGLDGLDEIYNHPPVSTEQVMHPAKCWEWRDFPVQIDLPEMLPGDWKQMSLETLGEAGIAVFFGCQLNNLNRGSALAQGWDGDHAGLYEAPGGHRLLLWASSWDSTNAAGRFVDACLKERALVHQAHLTARMGNRTEWESQDGRAGFIQREGKRVILVESDQPQTRQNAESYASAVTFTEPPEDAIRAAANNPLRRFNPLVAWQKDGDYSVTRSLGGLLSRHDRNRVGAADSVLLGLVGAWRRTASFQRWELGGGLVAKHESEARRGFTKTTVLPWGVLASHCAAQLPQSPDKTIARTSLLWGVGGSLSRDGASRRALRILPFGFLFSSTWVAGEMSLHVLGTGYLRKEGTDHSEPTERFRLFGIPIWTAHGPAAPAVPTPAAVEVE